MVTLDLRLAQIWYWLRFETYTNTRLLWFSGGSFQSINILACYTIEYSLKAILSSLVPETELSNKARKEIARGHDLVRLYNYCVRYGYDLGFNSNVLDLITTMNQTFVRYPSEIQKFRSKNQPTYHLPQFDHLFQLFDNFFSTYNSEFSIFLQAVNMLEYDDIQGIIFFHQNFPAIQKLLSQPDLIEKNPNVKKKTSREKPYVFWQERGRTLLNIETAKDLNEIVDSIRADKFVCGATLSLHG